MFASASALQQRLGDQLFLGPWRAHPADKLPNIMGEIPVTSIVKIVGNCSPAPLDFPPCPDKHAFSGFDSNISLTQLGGNGIGSFAGKRGIASQDRSMDAILSNLPAFTTYCSF